MKEMTPKLKALLVESRTLNSLKTKLTAYKKALVEWEAVPNNKQRRPEITLTPEESILFEESL